MDNKPYWIVSVQGDRFLGWGGGCVIEYPDARTFETQAAAEAAAKRFRQEGGYARAVSSKAYQEE